MKYFSTRDNKNITSLESALKQGLASDGGLFVPEKLPSFGDISKLDNLEFHEFAYNLLKPFFKDSSLENSLQDICKKAFNFPIPLVNIDNNLSILELFHGPTLAFKDFGARFLAQCLSRLEGEFSIVTATSGDTGGAVAAAFHGLENIKVHILYPKNGVSEGQRAQLNYWKDNINAYAYEGSFDDCQKNIKDTFDYFSSSKDFKPTSANSINIGRLLGQITYYSYISLKSPNSNYIIPSGNMGNALACVWSKEMGFPINNIILSCNSNKAVSHYLSSGELKKFNTINTLANAMDVGLPSNLERLDNLKSIEDINKICLQTSSTDSEIKETIKKYFSTKNYLADPHTACALNAFDKLKDSFHHIVVSTAHPVKFPKVFNELGLQNEISIPIEFQKCLDSTFNEITLSSFNEFIAKIK